MKRLFNKSERLTLAKLLSVTTPSAREEAVHKYAASRDTIIYNDEAMELIEEWEQGTLGTTLDS